MFNWPQSKEIQTNVRWPWTRFCRTNAVDLLSREKIRNSNGHYKLREPAGKLEGYMSQWDLLYQRETWPTWLLQASFSRLEPPSPINNNLEGEILPRLLSTSINWSSIYRRKVIIGITTSFNSGISQNFSKIINSKY